jgi:Spy/CpxP family protein refolding chaperone
MNSPQCWICWTAVANSKAEKTMRTLISAICALLLQVGAALAASPYAGQQEREIKALSAAEIGDLRAGRGMGLAKAAELNHYPGPRHALDLAHELGLSAAQANQTRHIFAAMSAAAQALGQRILAAEGELDAAFAGQGLDRAGLRQATAAIADLRGELRFVHLSAHLELKRVLSTEQVRHYDRLRGYSGAAGSGGHEGHGSHKGG